MRTLITRTIFLLLFLVVLHEKSNAQENRFAQEEIILRALAPSSLGAIEENNGQLQASYRSRWDQDTPYRDMFLAYQYRLKEFTLGGKLMQNDAGVASLAVAKLTLDLAYQKILNRSGDRFSFGASAGVVQNRMLSGQLKFDSQYNENTGFQEEYNSGETLMLDNQINPIFDAGFSFQKFFFASDLTLGLSAQNLTRYRQQFLSEAVNTPRTYNAYARYNIELADEIGAGVFIHYQYYAGIHVPLVLVQGRYLIDDEIEISAGLGKRLYNTALVTAGMKWKGLGVNLSYEMGAEKNLLANQIFEVGVSYQLKIEY